MRKGFLFCVAVLCSLLSFAQNDKGDIVKTGDNMPAFTLSSAVNGTVDSADLKGKVVLINIFATWCGPCQSELAEVQKILWPKYKDNKNFRMIVIGREHTDEELTAYNKRKGFTFPLYRIRNGKSRINCHSVHSQKLLNQQRRESDNPPLSVTGKRKWIS